MSLIDLPVSFWGYALKTAAFILNRAPSKSVAMTPYEIWHGKKPKLSFLKVWGCEAYVKKLQPDKLEPKSEKVIFVGYPRETIGYTFYNQAEGKTFVAKNGTFSEKLLLEKGAILRDKRFALSLVVEGVSYGFPQKPYKDDFLRFRFEFVGL